MEELESELNVQKAKAELSDRTSLRVVEEYEARKQEVLVLNSMLFILDC